MSKFGPTRGELKFRLCVGVFVCALLGLAAVVKGVPTGLVGVEMFLICGAFGAGSVVWNLWRLMR